MNDNFSKHAVALIATSLCVNFGCNRKNEHQSEMSGINEQINKQNYQVLSSKFFDRESVEDRGKMAQVPGLFLKDMESLLGPGMEIDSQDPAIEAKEGERENRNLKWKIWWKDPTKRTYPCIFAAFSNDGRIWSMSMRFEKGTFAR